MRKEILLTKVIEPCILKAEYVSFKKRNPLWYSLLLKYSINFILFLDNVNPLTLFVKKVKLLLVVAVFA